MDILYAISFHIIINLCSFSSIGCVTVTRGVIAAGLDGGPPYRLVFIRARAPPVAVCLVYKWRENLLGIVEL